MRRPTLQQLAKEDQRIARFLERSEKRAAKKKSSPKSIGDNMPKTYDISPEAAEAINRCIMG